MAKRRNLKKEKAERNLAYARKFRKNSTGRSFRNKRFGMNSTKKRKPEDDDMGDEKMDNGGAMS